MVVGDAMVAAWGLWVFVGDRCCAWFGVCWWFLQSVLCLVWCLLVIGGFFFFFFPCFVGGFYLGGVCVMVGWWWLLPCWVCVVVAVAVAEGRGGCCRLFLGVGYIIVVVILFYCDVYIILLY